MEPLMIPGSETLKVLNSPFNPFRAMIAKRSIYGSGGRSIRPWLGKPHSCLSAPHAYKEHGVAQRDNLFQAY